MRLFKSKNKKNYPMVQTVESKSRAHPFQEIKRYVPLDNPELKLYSILREAVPIIDAAICKTVRLIGNFAIDCKDKNIKEQLNKFISTVRVNCCEEGMEFFISTYFDQLLTYGTAVGEIVVDPCTNTIAALYNSSLSDVILKTGRSPLELIVCRKNEDGSETPVKYQDLILTTPLKPEPGKINGTSILKGLPFVSEILLSIYQSIGTNWDRVGNVRFAVTYKPSSDVGDRAFAKERVQQVADQWSQAMHSGSSLSDFISFGDVSIKVIGADNQILDSQVPVRQMLEQIVSKLSIPPFLLGLCWSTTERMSTQQADILTSELEFYRRLLTSVISKICRTWLNINGYVTDFDVIWDNINLQDEVETANAKLMRARASEIEKRLEMNQ